MMASQPASINVNDVSAATRTSSARNSCMAVTPRQREMLPLPLLAKKMPSAGCYPLGAACTSHFFGRGGGGGGGARRGRGRGHTRPAGQTPASNIEVTDGQAPTSSINVNAYAKQGTRGRNRPHADLSRDRWIQSPECQPLHHETR